MPRLLNVDFVIPWVDGSDPVWLEDFNQNTVTLEGDKRKCRYRDWDNLKYIFRSFEKCTPWARKIHFVTYGHLPAWLNTKHEWLNIVNHSDFLSQEILPVFNVNPIEINLHKIPGISDYFLYLNDDMFILKDLPIERFFKKKIPCDMLSTTPVPMSPIAHILFNDLAVINKNFKKHEFFLNNIFKVFNLRYGLIELLKTSLTLPWPYFTGFTNPHQPQPFLKSTFDELWANERGTLSKTSKSKIRSCEDVNQYLFRYWQLCSGRFSPVSFKKTYSNLVQSYSDAKDMSRKILSGKYDMICVNDDLPESEFERSKEVINDALNKIFPNKSSFEK